MGKALRMWEDRGRYGATVDRGSSPGGARGSTDCVGVAPQGGDCTGAATGTGSGAGVGQCAWAKRQRGLWFVRCGSGY